MKSYNLTLETKILLAFWGSINILLIPNSYILAPGYMLVIAIGLPIFLNFASFGFKQNILYWLFPPLFSIMIIFYYDFIWALGVTLESFMDYNQSGPEFKAGYPDFNFFDRFLSTIINPDHGSVVVSRLIFEVSVGLNIICFVIKIISRYRGKSKL